ncbi:uncharacterized protein MONOS_14170 [Monocercomonoides exilis]|uniref:uncharacterized protein n=1 Tax=Monocercomonoides exilis TaxID=2049356 RepID=UPI00355AAA74|nr:hypothetical protein MONOS_14170 [Monocercomonoides exilis]|eukprot:MONOS_14170.1-p1 / transcript=MONOS_14170.1 / gene=MONOS_14170 / organism=Monocercomonoides_exilis_PA203 / gene_product=unspecified product / transcript_product=unspecified product / location=Mono_scaffold00950:5763-7547(+) / protein_length=505 / sequence_SO=supercontig / SO=protein_coding / is_pseudo=false
MLTNVIPSARVDESEIRSRDLINSRRDIIESSDLLSEGLSTKVQHDSSESQLSECSLNSAPLQSSQHYDKQLDSEEKSHSGFSRASSSSSSLEESTCSSSFLLDDENDDMCNWWLKEESAMSRLQQKEPKFVTEDESNPEEETEHIPPALIILDGHSSRQNLQLWKRFAAENVDVVVIPAHTSHILQPLDLGPNAVLKCQLKKVRNEPSIRRMKREFLPFVRAIADCAYMALAPKTIRHGFFEAGITSSTIKHVLDQIIDSLPPEVKPAKKTFLWSISGQCITNDDFIEKWETHEKEKEFSTLNKKAKTQTEITNPCGVSYVADCKINEQILESVKSLHPQQKNGQSLIQEKIVEDSNIIEEETEPSDSQEGEDNILDVPLFRRSKNKRDQAFERFSICDDDSYSECESIESDSSSSLDYTPRAAKKTKSDLRKSKIKKKRIIDDNEQDYDKLDNDEEINEKIGETTINRIIPKLYSTRSIKTMTNKYSEQYVIFPDSDDEEEEK